MDTRFIRPPSPGSRRYGTTGRSSTGNLDLRDYESYYSNPRSSRDSLTSGARLSSERLAPRSAPRGHRESLPVRRNPDDYAVPPRRIAEPDPVHPLSRRALNVITTSSPRYQPVISSAVENSPSTYSKTRGRDDDAYILPASSSSRHHRHYSAGNSAYLAVNRDRDRDRHRGEKGGYRSSGVGKSYYTGPPPIRQPRDPYDSDYGYEYTNRTEQAYRDTEPRPRNRRGSDTGPRERPNSITSLEDFYKRQPVASRDAGPPVTTRGFSKLDPNGSVHHEYRYPRETGHYHRDSSITRGSRDEGEGLSRRRSNRAPVALHQEPDDLYPPNIEEHNRHKHRHTSRRADSMEKDDDRGLGIRYQEGDARRADEKPRRHLEKIRSESEDRYRHHHNRREVSEDRYRTREPRREGREEDSERERKYNVERDDRERRHRHDSDDKEHRHRHNSDDKERRHHESRKEKHEGSKLGEGLALGVAGATALVAGKSHYQHEKEQSNLDSEKSPRHRRHHRDHNRSTAVLDPSESSSRSEDTDEERKERHRRRRKEREERGENGGKSRGTTLVPPVTEARSGPDGRNVDPQNDTRPDGKERKSRRHRDPDRDSELTPESEGSTNERASRDIQTTSRVRVLSPAKTEEPKPKGILRPPREKFPEDPAPVREGVAPLKDAGKKGVPPNARWTKIDRRLVNPEALEMGNERYEERVEYVIVLRVLTKEEIEKYAALTLAIRGE